MEPEMPLQQQQPEINAASLYQLLKGALTHGHESVSNYQQQLQLFGEEARPNYVLSLLEIVSNHTLEEDVRLFAAVLSKNFCGSPLHKRLATRPWSKVSDAEKENIRSYSLSALEQEPSEKVSIQIILLIANISGYDFPQKWPNLLNVLLEWVEGNDLSPHALRKRLRAVRTFKHVGRALQQRRMIVAQIDDDIFVSGFPAHATLARLAQQANQEKQAINTETGPCADRLLKAWQSWWQIFKQGEYKTTDHGEIALESLSAAHEVYLAYCNTLSRGSPTEAFDPVPLLSEAASTAHLRPAEAGQDEDRGTSLGICSRMFERITDVINSMLRFHPRLMGPHCYGLLRLYLDHCLLVVSAADVQNMRPKRLQHMVRLIGFCLLLADSPSVLRGVYDTQESDSNGEKFVALVNQICGGPETLQILAAVLSKYLVITENELNMWKEDPEQYFHTMDLNFRVESTDRRALGLQLLRNLLMKSMESVLAAMHELARGLEEATPSASTVLLREACYLAIGDTLQMRVLINRNDDFQNWYQKALRPVIENPSQPEDAAVEYRALRCRALWVLSVNDLPQDLLCDVVDLAARNLQHTDVVVALQAVSTLTGLMKAIVAHLQALAAEDELSGAYHLARLITPHLRGEADMYNDTVQHMTTIATSFLQSLMALQAKLMDVESQTQVLSLIGLLLELVGKRSQEVVLAVVNIWVQAWNGAFGGQANLDKSTAIQLQSTIMDLFMDLVECMGAEVAQQPQMREASQGLLTQSLQADRQANAELTESGLRLLTTLFVNDPGGAENYKVFIPRLLELLEQGKNDSAVFQLLVQFIVMVYPDHQSLLQPIMPTLLAVILNRLTAAFIEAIEATVDHPEAVPGLELPGNSSQTQMQQLRKKLSRKAEQQRTRGQLGSLEGLFPRQPVIDEETVDSMEEACTLLQTLLLLRIDDNALLPSIRWCAVIATHNNLPDQITDKPLSVVQKALFYNPVFYTQHIFANAQTACTFLERSFLCVRRRYVVSFGVPLDALLRASRQERHLVAACFCSLGLANALPAMRRNPFLSRVMLVLIDAMSDAPSYNKAVQALEEAVSAPDAQKDRHVFQNQRLTLQDSLYICDVGELGTKFVKQVINDQECIQQLQPTLLSVLTRILAENESKVSNGEIQDLMAQMGQASLS